MIEKPPLNMTFVDTRGLFSLSDKINIEVVEVPEINNKMIVLRDLFKYQKILGSILNVVWHLFGSLQKTPETL